MKHTLKPLATLLVLAGLGALLAWAFVEGRAELAMEQERERPVKAPSRVATAGEESVVTLSPEELAHAGIVVASVKTTAYPNARQAPGTVIDTEEMLGMQRHLEAARARLRDLPASAAALEAVAEGVRRRWGDVIARWLTHDAPPWQRLRRGQNRLIRVALAPGESPPPDAWLEIDAGKRTALTLVSPLPETMDEKGARVLYLAPADTLRKTYGAGNNVTVALPGGRAERAVSVPESAVVWWDGRAWVYVSRGPGRFVRRAVTVRPGTGNELIATRFSAADAVVVSGAQLLLSEEQRAQIQVGEEGK